MRLCLHESADGSVFPQIIDADVPEVSDAAEERTAPDRGIQDTVGQGAPDREDVVTLAKTIWLSGKVAPPALCSGLGRCGACRVRFLKGIPEPVDADRLVLGEVAVTAGWRLACRHGACAGMEIELQPPPAARTERLTGAKRSGGLAGLTEQAGRASGKAIRIAVDLGTTSVHWQAFDENGMFLRGQALNPQMGAGSDVVSRLAAARTVAGRGVLRKLILHFLQRIVTDTCAASADETTPVAELCIAGNTAMTAILLDRDVSGLASAPYQLPDCGGESVSLPGLPPVWIPPQPAPFVGGDISAGMATLLYGQDTMYPFLLADLGTNGECVLALDEEQSLVTSVPLGPSLEGIGLTHGGVAGIGSISGFRIGPTGLLPQVIGGGLPQAVCGTGYLSLLHVLIRIGFLRTDGRLAGDSLSGVLPSCSNGQSDQSLSPLARKLRQTVRTDPNGAWCLPLSGGLCLTAFDVEEILKVKAAFSLALESLLAEAGLSSRELTRVTLGGALGEHVPLDALESLGFFPPGLGARVRAGGNTSLAGATLLLARPELRVPLIRWSGQCRVLDLTARADFSEQYMRHMFFG